MHRKVDASLPKFFAEDKRRKPCMQVANSVNANEVIPTTAEMGSRVEFVPYRIWVGELWELVSRAASVAVAGLSE